MSRKNLAASAGRATPDRSTPDAGNDAATGGLAIPRPEQPPQTPPAWARYGLALLMVAAATGLRLLMDPWLGQNAVPYVTFNAAVALTAFLWGRGPGVAATIVGGLACDYFISPPRFSFELATTAEFAPMLLFMATGLLVSLLAGHLRAARRLAEDRHRLLAVTLASIGDGVIVTDAQGRVTFLNQEAEQLTGWTSSQAQGLELPAVFHIVNEATRQPVESPVEKVLRQGTVVGLANHTILLARDGRAIPIDDSGAPIRLEDGTVQGVVLVFRDFSERKRAETALLDSERRYRTLFESMDEGFALCEMIYDPDGRPSDFRYLNVNPAFEKLTGLSAAQVIGKSVTLAIPGIEPFWIERYGQVVATGQSQRFANQVSPLGRQFEVYAYSPAPGRFAAIFTDVTERKRAEEELHRLVQQLSYHVENSPLAVIEWGPDMRLTRWSGGAERLFGWKAEEVLGKRMEDFRWIYHEDAPRVAEVSADLTTGRDPQRFSANRNYRKDGSVVHCEWYNSSLLDASGKLVSILSLVLDVTDRTRAEEELRQANTQLEQRVARRTGQLAQSNAQLQAQIDAYHRLEAEVARLVEQERLRLGMELHDNLCQQLAATGMLAATLAKRLGGQLPPLADMAARIVASLTQAGTDAHALARGLLPVQVEADGLMVALAGLVQRTQDMQNVACAFVCATPVPVDNSITATNLFRIAQEALQNAVKHGQARHITVTLTNHDAVTLTITDDGVGISPEHTRAPGSGLRLMAYRARVIGADLSVEPAPAGGTRVRCVLSGGTPSP